MFWEKRKRGQNFTADEKDRLVKILSQHKETILCKRTDGSTNEAKARAWIDVTNTYNSCTSVFRSKESLMKVWEKLKTESKLYYESSRRSYTGTGGGPSLIKVDPILEQVCVLLGRACTGILGVQDSDTVEPTLSSSIEYAIPQKCHTPIGDDNIFMEVLELENEDNKLTSETPSCSFNENACKTNIPHEPTISKTPLWSRRRPQKSQYHERSEPQNRERSEAMSSLCMSFTNVNKKKEDIEDIKRKILEEELEFKRKIYEAQLQSALKEVEIRDEILRQLKGLIMEPNKRYTQVVEKPFHISQAAMDISTGDNDPCQVMVVVDGKNFLVCTLQKNKCIQVPLDLYFKAGDAISFLTNGKCNVHLTGYLDPEFEEEEASDEEEDEEEEEEEAPALVPAKNKRKLDNSNDSATTKKVKKEKLDKKVAAADSSDSDEDEEDPLQKFLDGEDIDTDENDDSFKVNASGEADSDEEESDDDAEEAEEEEDEDDKDEMETSGEAETTLDTSKEEAKVDMSKLTKSQKRRLKKKMREQAKAQPQVNGVENQKKEKKDSQQAKPEKKKQDAKKEPQESAAEKKVKKSLSGGVSIEDTKVGAGPVAKPGKVVMVYYEGRLKQNNKMFDNCMKGPGFKFKLGAKEVIAGWDVGISGMKVGGKRRIICPPAMAYGAKGSPPVIPPNSTLVFDVELKNVK